MFEWFECWHLYYIINHFLFCETQLSVAFSYIVVHPVQASSHIHCTHYWGALLYVHKHNPHTWTDTKRENVHHYMTSAPRQVELMFCRQPTSWDLFLYFCGNHTLDYADRVTVIPPEIPIHCLLCIAKQSHKIMWQVIKCCDLLLFWTLGKHCQHDSADSFLSGRTSTGSVQACCFFLLIHTGNQFIQFCFLWPELGLKAIILENGLGWLWNTH